MKKKWNKPFIQVIVRHKPEESVLTSCKKPGGGSGAASQNNSCKRLHACVPCLADMPS